MLPLLVLQGPVRSVDPHRLPAPYATQSAENPPQSVSRDGAPLHGSPGFRVEPFAAGPDGPADDAGGAIWRVRKA